MWPCFNFSHLGRENRLNLTSSYIRRVSACCQSVFRQLRRHKAFLLPIWGCFGLDLLINPSHISRRWQRVAECEHYHCPPGTHTHTHKVTSCSQLAVIKQPGGLTGVLPHRSREDSGVDTGLSVCSQQVLYCMFTTRTNPTQPLSLCKQPPLFSQSDCSGRRMWLKACAYGSFQRAHINYCYMFSMAYWR